MAQGQFCSCCKILHLYCVEIFSLSLSNLSALGAFDTTLAVTTVDRGERPSLKCPLPPSPKHLAATKSPSHGNYRKAATRERVKERACHSSPRHNLPCLFSIYYTESSFFFKLARHLSGAGGIGLRHARARLVSVILHMVFFLFRNVVVMNQGHTFRQTEDKKNHTFPLPPCSLPKLQNLSTPPSLVQRR